MELGLFGLNKITGTGSPRRSRRLCRVVPTWTPILDHCDRKARPSS